MITDIYVTYNIYEEVFLDVRHVSVIRKCELMNKNVTGLYGLLVGPNLTRLGGGGGGFLRWARHRWVSKAIKHDDTLCIGQN